jgi:hypothetical protein
VDKDTQISHMPAIYASADVTIAAACSPSARIGFLDPPDVSSRNFLFHLEGLGSRHVSFEGESGSVEPLDTRGWTLQETALSRRLLSFGTHSISLDCMKKSVEFNSVSHRVSQTPRTFLRQVSSSLAAQEDSAEFHKLWITLVEEYTRRQLTLPNDRLLAISGLADRVSLSGGGRYLAGLWEAQLPRGLLWIGNAPGTRRNMGRAPSWSWATIDGEVFFPQVEKNSEGKIVIRPTLTVHNSSVVANHAEARYGAVRPGGYLCISGLMREARLANNSDDDSGVSLFDPTLGYKMAAKVHLDTGGDVPGDGGVVVHLLNYFSTSGIQILQRDGPRPYTVGFLLVPVDGKERGFQRIGIYDAGKVTGWFEKSSMETIYLY